MFNISAAREHGSVQPDHVTILDFEWAAARVLDYDEGSPYDHMATLCFQLEWLTDRSWWARKDPSAVDAGRQDLMQDLRTALDALGA